MCGPDGGRGGWSSPQWQARWQGSGAPARAANQTRCRFVRWSVRAWPHPGRRAGRRAPPPAPPQVRPAATRTSRQAWPHPGRRAGRRATTPRGPHKSLCRTGLEARAADHWAGLPGAGNGGVRAIRISSLCPCRGTAAGCSLRGRGLSGPLIVRTGRDECGGSLPALGWQGAQDVMRSERPRPFSAGAAARNHARTHDLVLRILILVGNGAGQVRSAVQATGGSIGPR